MAVSIKKDGRTIRSGVDYTEFRRDLHDHQFGRCYRCRSFTSLADEPLMRTSFHVHHVGGRGMGGSKRDDVFSKVEGLCGSCHREEHNQSLA